MHPEQKAGFCMEQYIDEGVKVINREKDLIEKEFYKNYYNAPDVICIDEEAFKKYMKLIMLNE